MRFVYSRIVRLERSSGGCRLSFYGVFIRKYFLVVGEAIIKGRRVVRCSEGLWGVFFYSGYICIVL